MEGSPSKFSSQRASGKIVPLPYLADLKELGREAPFLGEYINIPSKNLFVPYYNIPPDFTESAYFLSEAYSFWDLARKIYLGIIPFKEMTNEDFDFFLGEHASAVQKEFKNTKVDDMTWLGPQAGSGEASSAQNANLKFILKYENMVKKDLIKKDDDAVGPEPPVRTVEKMTPKNNSSTSSLSIAEQIEKDRQLALELAQNLDEVDNNTMQTENTNNATMPITVPTKIPTKKKEIDMTDLDENPGIMKTMEKKVQLHRSGFYTEIRKYISK